MIAAVGFRFAQPWWLLACALAVPVVWLGWRSLASLGRARRVAAIGLRVLVIWLLAALLARPMLSSKHEELTLIAVIDRSRSIPTEPVDVQAEAMDYLAQAVASKPPGDQLAVIDVGEQALIARLPSVSTEVPQRNISLPGEQSALAGGVELALAIAPPDTATRILLISDGNETAGDLAGAARVAAANSIPIDVLPVRYKYEREVVFRRLVAPSRARSGQTVDLRFVLASTAKAQGRLTLSLNGRPVDLDPTTVGMAVPVTLQPGTNVKTISLPLGTRGMHDFEAIFIPDQADPPFDRLAANNRAAAMTFVAGPGHVLVVDGDGKSGADLAGALGKAGMDVRHCLASELPENLTALLDADAVVLVNAENSSFTFRQQEMLCRYVADMGGGLVMVGGPESFGAGGWIGSPAARVIPVDLDPPQKKVMPKGALVLIMHACEMPQGNFWGKQTAIAAAKSLSRRDLVGVLDYGWQAGAPNWVYPLSEVGDKQAVTAAIRRMTMGDMPDFGPPMQVAYDKLKACDAAQKHIIIISDGDPQMPKKEKGLLKKLRKAGITCSGVAVFPHDPGHVASLVKIARATGGRFYNVKDPKQLPRIFIKEAQVVRRALIVEEKFTPKATGSMAIRGLPLRSLPDLDGYVLTGPKKGLTRVALTSARGDPLLATGQMGMGRAVAFTSSADSRWASRWLAWGGFQRFWEQIVRWAGKPAQASDCEVYTDVHGRNVTVSVEAVNAAGEFVQLTDIGGHVIAPDMSRKELTVSQVGPGSYRAGFDAAQFGGFLVSLRYRKAGADSTSLIQTVAIVPYAPEFEDLTDNLPLLARVAASTGGRVLGGDPSKVNLFDRSGLRFPETPLPLTRPLMLIWLGLFLLDVAVRRVALDVRSAARRVGAALGRLRPRRDAAGRTLARLQARRRQVRDRLVARGRKGAAARRYEAPEGGPEPPELPLAEQRPEAPAVEQGEAQRPTEQPEDESHLGRLLRAKRQARDRMKKDKDK